MSDEHDIQIELRDGDALVVVDVQNDFIPGGALPVAEGDKIVQPINALMRRFAAAGLTVVLTQDWHNPDHLSSASQHAGKEPYDLFEAPGLGPVLWPDHCVQGTAGAAFHQELSTDLAHAVIRKGYHRHVDSYSGFLENDHATETGLDGYLRNRGVRRILIVGLAFDYCVFFTASDGMDKGYEVIVIRDLSRPVGSPENSVSNAMLTMAQKGVSIVEAAAIAGAPALLR